MFLIWLIVVLFLTLCFLLLSLIFIIQWFILFASRLRSLHSKNSFFIVSSFKFELLEYHLFITVFLIFISLLVFLLQLLFLFLMFTSNMFHVWFLFQVVPTFLLVFFLWGKKKNTNSNFWVRISSGGVGVFHLKGWRSKNRYVLRITQQCWLKCLKSRTKIAPSCKSLNKLIRWTTPQPQNWGSWATL